MTLDDMVWTERFVQREMIDWELKKEDGYYDKAKG